MSQSENKVHSVGSEQRANRFGLVLGFGLLVMVAIVYLTAVYYRLRPAGHPAAAMVWCIAGFIILKAAMRPQKVPQWFYYVWTGLVIVGMILWLATTFQWISA